jgi:hypothetical protein
MSNTSQNTTTATPLDKCNNEIARYESGLIDKLSQECFENFINQQDENSDKELFVTVTLSKDNVNGKVVPATMTFNPNEKKMAGLTPIKITKFDTAVAPGTGTGTAVAPGTGTGTAVAPGPVDTDKSDKEKIQDISDAIADYKNVRTKYPNAILFSMSDNATRLTAYDEFTNIINNILNKPENDEKYKMNAIKSYLNNITTNENTKKLKELIYYINEGYKISSTIGWTPNSKELLAKFKNMITVLQKETGVTLVATKRGGSSHRQKSRRNNKFSKSMKYAGRSTHKTAKKHGRRRLTRKTMRYSSSLV